MEKLKVNLVLEILGRPAEHVKEALNTIVVKLGAEKGVKIINKTYHDPVEVKDSKDLYTSFAEVSLDIDSLANYFSIIFSYMPAHIEMISPERVALTNAELNELANQTVLRLHNYDGIAKKIIFERDILIKRLHEVAPHLFKKDPEVIKQEKNEEKVSKEKSLEDSLSSVKESKKIKKRSKKQKTA